MDQLDLAVLRRFDLKIQFNYLRPDQAGKLFMRVLSDLQRYTRLLKHAESVEARFSQLRTLTPGDFATVVRQAGALGTSYDAEQLLGALEAECLAKASGRKQVKGIHEGGLRQRLLRGAGERRNSLSTLNRITPT